MQIAHLVGFAFGAWIGLLFMIIIPLGMFPVFFHAESHHDSPAGEPNRVWRRMVGALLGVTAGLVILLGWMIGR
jgi:hypothetical protein